MEDIKVIENLCRGYSIQNKLSYNLLKQIGDILQVSHDNYQEAFTKINEIWIKGMQELNTALEQHSITSIEKQKDTNKY